MPRVEIDNSIILEQDKIKLKKIIKACQWDHSGLQDILRHSLYYMKKNSSQIEGLSVSFVETIFKAFVISIQTSVPEGGEFRIS